MKESERKWTDYTDEEKLLVIDGYLDGVVALDDENEKVNKQRLEWIRAHIPAYKVEGGKNYIFVSYSHLDYKDVYKDLAAFSYNSQRRVRFWYDEGLPIGQDWEKAAGELIKNPHCVGVLFYLSKNLLLSPSVFKEIDYVKNLNKPYCTIALDDGLYSASKIFDEAKGSELRGVEDYKKELEAFFPDNNTALPYGNDNLLFRIDKIAEAFDVTEEVFSDFVCEECDGGLRLVAYRGNKTEVHIPEKIGDKSVVEVAADFPHAVTIYIPKTITGIGALGQAENLEEILVDEENPQYYDINGVLCMKDFLWEEKKGNVILRAPACWDWEKQFADYKIVERLGKDQDLHTQIRNIIEEKEGSFFDRLKDKRGFPESYNELNNVTFFASVWSLYDDGYEDDYLEVFENLFSFTICYLKNYANIDISDFGYAIIYKKINTIYNFIKKLKSFSVFKEINFIAMNAFRGCKNLDYLFLHDNIEEIDCGAFENSNASLIFLPDSLKEVIYGGLFRGCKKLQSVLTETDYYATHEECTFNKALFFGNLEKIVCDIEDARITGVEFKNGINLANCSFIKCGWLREITVPKVRSLYNAFSHCIRLREVILEEGTEEISSCCFSDCLSLKHIKVPKSVKFIDDTSFLGCENLETIEYDGTIAEWRTLENTVYDSKEGWKSQGKGVKIICTDGVIEPSYED